MITAGTKVKIIGVGKADCVYKHRKDFVGKIVTVTDNQGLRQWKDNKTFYGDIKFDVNDLPEHLNKYEDFHFHSVRVKII